MKFTLDPEKITLGDMADFESAAGMSIGDALEQYTNGDMNLTALLPMVLLAGRQSNPDFTIEQVRALTITELEFEVVDEDPTNGND